MNFKTRNSNITKVLYIVLVLCISSILFLSIYSVLNQKDNPENQNDKGNDLNNFNINNDNVLQNNEPYDDSEDAILDIFRKKEATTETPTQIQTQKPTEPPKPAPTEAPTTPVLTIENAIIPPDSEQGNQIATTDKTADIIIDPAENAVEVLSVPVPTIFVKPVSGFVSRDHNPDTPEYSIAMNDYRTHMGVDIDSEIGIKVKAVSDGVISDIFDDPLMGKTVVIDHAENIQSIYMNLQDLLPKNITVGAKVKVGDVIGGVGETALIEMYDVPHLHFEMKKDGSYTDPLEYIK